MIYLDSSATTHKHPRSVVKAVIKTIKNSANPSRSGHDLSLLSGSEIFEAREHLNKYFNGYGAEYVVFTSSCTQSLNLAIQGTVKRGGHIVATVLEHNSVLRPLQQLQNRGEITFSLAKPNAKGFIDAESIRKEMKPNTYLIITTHINNVFGCQTDIEGISKLASSKKILYLVDGAQSAGCKKIDLKTNNISMLAIPSHKGLMGVCGGGALLFNPKVPLRPIIFGGTGTSSQNLEQPNMSPEAYESGTLPTVAIASMKAGVNYISTSQSRIKKQQIRLSNYLLDNLKNINRVTLYTKQPNGVIAFNIADLPSTDIAQILNDRYGICTRAGLHCSPLTHSYLGTTQQGAVRVSVNYFNTIKELKKFIYAIKEIAN